jgi:NADH/NAD ratio-sensing transcriptional regulator Rex
MCKQISGTEGIAIKEKYNVSDFSKENDVTLGIVIRNDEETQKIVNALSKK